MDTGRNNNLESRMVEVALELAEMEKERERLVGQMQVR